jgi:hypothetical protein
MLLCGIDNHLMWEISMQEADTSTKEINIDVPDIAVLDY